MLPYRCSCARSSECGASETAAKYRPVWLQEARGSAMSSPRAPPVARGGQNPGSLPAEVFAMCGVVGPLRQMDLAAHAAAISRLEHMACPLEGINCLQVMV